MGAKRRPTMADVAELAGVSLSTVSLTYSGAGPITDETRAKVEKAAETLGYGGPSPLGKRLRSGRTDIVAVVIPERLSRAFRDPHALRTMDGLLSELGEMGLGVLLVPAATGADGERPLVESAAMDAAVVMRVRSEGPDPTLEILAKRGIPAATLDAPHRPGLGNVSLDDRRGTADLIRKLVALGHERIGTVTLPWGYDGTTEVHDSPATPPLWASTSNRLDAFADAGVEPCVVVEARASMVEEGIAAGHLALSHSSRPTAIVAQSDLLAAGVVLAARELEMRVPHDVSVTGFDGLDLPWLAPHELTTMVQDSVAKGRILAKEVKALLEGETPAPVMTEVTFREGTTIAKAPR